MFLAIAEIRHSKLRYILIMLTIALIGYLTFILTALAYGLAQSNRSVVDSWHASSIVLDTDADGALRQSALSADQVDAITSSHADSASIGELSAIVTTSEGKNKTSVEVVGIEKNQFIYRDMQTTQGRRFDTAHEAVVDDGLISQGYALGDTVTIASGERFTITGFMHNAKLSVAPVVYVPMQSWRTLKYGATTPSQTQTQTQAQLQTQQPAQAQSLPEASAVVQRAGAGSAEPRGTQRLPIATFIDKLPGYSAQNITFTLMIGFLFVITLVIIAIFQYILTMQKIPNYMVLKIQGIPTWFLVRSMMLQALLIALAGVAIAAALTAVSAAVIPPSVPVSFATGLLGAAAAAIIAMSILGSLASVRAIATIKPTSVVAGE